MNFQNDYQTFLDGVEGIHPSKILQELFRIKENSSLERKFFYKVQSDNLELKKKIKQLEAVNRELVLTNRGEDFIKHGIWYKKALKTCFVEAKKRAVKNNLEFSIEFDDLCLRYKEPYCFLSNIPYFQCKKFSKNPFNPSIDRIDSNKGYTKENTRVVAACINNAMNEWGEEILQFISVNYMLKMIANTPNKLIQDILDQ